MPSILEPLPYVQTYQLIDYDDLAAARDGLTQLSRHLERYERKIESQRSAIAAHYGLKSMMDNLLRIYSHHAIEVPR
jgi:hypothetical protein